jgi:NTE family protein
MATENKTLLLKMHGCSHGLSGDAIREIADAAELMRFEPGEYVHHAHDVVTSVYLVIHGRLRTSAVDLNGNVLLQRFQSSGGQFGGIAAALTEPAQVDCIAEDRSTLLRIDYPTALELTKRHDVFRMNMTRILAESLKQTLLKDKRPVRAKLVAIFHQSPDTRTLIRVLVKRLVDLDESICVLSDRPDWGSIEGVQHLCAYERNRLLTEEDARRQINEWLTSNRVLIDVETSFDSVRASTTLEVAEQILWCVTPQNWAASVDRLKALQAQSPAWRDKVTIIWLLDNEQEAPLATELRKFAAQDIKLSFAEPAPKQGRAIHQGFERLVHLLRGVKIGVALGGGAARGMAHLGVLKALAQYGIFVDMIAGTSAGAMTGTLYASGMEADYSIECFVKDLRPSWFFQMLPRGEQWHLLYKYRRGQFDPMLRKYLRDNQLEQLPIPMHTITVDLIGGQAVIRDFGDAVHAITESINLPVLSTPINRNGQALVDGGLINNIPADVLAQKGCNFVIAVSVTAKMEEEFARNRSDTPTSQMKAASTIQTLLRSYFVQSANINAMGVQPADFVIEPDATAFELTAFTRTDELANVGEKATIEAIPKIKQLLANLDSKLFQLPKTVST